MIAMEAKPGTAKLSAGKAQAIFLSLDTAKDTGKEHGASPGLVMAIWTRKRWFKATMGLKRPSQEAIEAHRQGRPRRKSPTRLRLEEFILANAADMTAIEMGAAFGCTAHHVRLVCRELDIRPKRPAPTELSGVHLKPIEAEDDYEPDPLPPGEELDAPPGSFARIELLRRRVERKVELWDAENALRLPRCLARIETPQMENVT